MTTPQDKTAALEALDIDYRLEHMPNGNFVGEVYYLTHAVIKDLGCHPDNEQFCAAEDTIRDYVWKACQRASLLQPAWQEMPKGWHVSWMGEDDGSFLCQIKRHDNDLDYLSDISFVSRKSLVSMQQAYNFAIDEVLKSYSPPPTDIDSGRRRAQ